MKFIKTFNQAIDESIAMTDHFDTRVKERIFGAYIKKLEPINGNMLLDAISRDDYNNSAKRIKIAFKLALEKVKNNNRFRHAEMNHFCIIQLPHIFVKFGEVIYKPTFSIKNPNIEGSVYYLVGRNTSLKTVLLLTDIETSHSFLADKMLVNIKRHGDAVGDEELSYYENLSKSDVLEKTDFYDVKQSGSNDVIIDMSVSESELSSHIQSQLEPQSFVKKETVATSFAEILGQSKDFNGASIGEKQMVVTKGRVMPMTFGEEFRLTDISTATFKKDPAHVVMFTRSGTTSGVPFIVCRPDFKPKIQRGSLDKITGFHKPLKVLDKIWIKPSNNSEHDLALGEKLFQMKLDQAEMKYAYFYGEVTSVTNSSRDGIIIKIQPSKMIFFKDDRIIESTKYRNK